MHGGNLLAAMEKYGRSTFIDLSANINPFGPPDEVWDAIKKALPQIIHYPDPEYRRLRRVLAQKLNLPEEWIVLGNGAGELLFSILQALRPKKVLIPVPAFGEYERAARACGAEINTFTLGAQGWKCGILSGSTAQNQQVEVSELWKKSLQVNDLLFLNTPHNPTGSRLDQRDFELLLSSAQEAGTTIIVDESFVDFLEDEIRWSARAYLKDYPNLVVLYSMTKFYSIPGLRLGAVFAAPEILKRVKKHRDPWAVNSLAEEAGIVALKDTEYPIRVRKLLKESKEFFYRSFEELQLSHLALRPSSANFALIEILKGQSKDRVENLGKQGVLVRDCGNFQGLEGEFIRVAIKDIPSMQALIDGMRRSEWDV